MLDDNDGSSADNPQDGAADIDSKIAYHEEMAYLANKAGDFTKAEHHIRMQEIYKAMKKHLSQ
jgi:hypothetical protein